MPIIEEKKSNFKIASAGMHLAVCYQTLDLGTQPGSKLFPAPKRKLLLAWEIHDEFTDDGQPLSIRREFGYNAYNEKADFNKVLVSWLGVSPKPPFDTACLLDKPCLLNVVHEEDGDKIYANVVGVMPLMKGQAAPQAVNPLVDFSLHPDYYNADVFAGLPDWLQAKIAKSPEYKAIHSPKTQDDYEKSGFTGKTSKDVDMGNAGVDVPIGAYEFGG